MIESWIIRAKEIKSLHDGITSSMRKSVGDAVKIGELLSIQKEEMQYGRYLSWIKTELPFSEATAKRYIQLFEYRDKTLTVSDLQTAYQKVHQLESEKKQQEQARRDKLIADYKATGQKGEGWDQNVYKEIRKQDDEAAFQRRVQEGFGKKEREGQQTGQEAQAAHDRFWQEMIEDILKNPPIQDNQDLKLADLRDDVRQKGIFVVLQEYIQSFDGVSRQLEAVHNLMVFLRRVGNELQTKTQPAME